ncbi:MAG: hypothetical protein ACRD17_11255, partial [Terriglobales bacterium]
DRAPKAAAARAASATAGARTAAPDVFAEAFPDAYPSGLPIPPPPEDMPAPARLRDRGADALASRAVTGNGKSDAPAADDLDVPAYLRHRS